MNGIYKGVTSGSASPDVPADSTGNLQKNTL